MTKFDDTPNHKRRRAWDGQAMSRPWTLAQQDLVRKLSREVGAPWPISGPRLSVKAASAEIDALLSRRRNGIFGRAATRR